MNFLAHFHLAWPDEGLIAGALEGDFYKGPLRGDLPIDMANGITLHRAIDAYTDAHPAVRALRAQMPRNLRRYAGILIDLGFDHALCRHWQRYSPLAAPAFNAHIYRTLEGWQPHFSLQARAMSTRLIEHDLLHRYRDWQTITAAAERIGQRFRRGNPFNNIDQDLSPLQPQLEEAFLEFYPDLLQFARQQRDELDSAPAKRQE